MLKPFSLSSKDISADFRILSFWVTSFKLTDSNKFCGKGTAFLDG